MTLDEIDEAKSILSTMMTALFGTVSGATGQDAAELYYAIGDLLANADTFLRAMQMGAALLNVFDLAFTAGATIDNMELVRLTLTAESPVGLPAIAVTNIGIQMALSEEVKILAATTFTSRQDVAAALAAINGAFESAEEFAADNKDPTSYQALIGAHAAIVRDLTTRAKPLPNMITYSFGRVMTSHTLANRLYGDASRCDELVQENKAIQPAFMPISGTALSE